MALEATSQNLVPRAFLRRREGGWKALSSAEKSPGNEVVQVIGTNRDLKVLQD